MISDFLRVCHYAIFEISDVIEVSKLTFNRPKRSVFKSCEFLEKPRKILRRGVAPVLNKDGQIATVRR